MHTRHPETGRVVVQVPLLGDSVTLGELYMDLPIGSPPANYSAQVDTGSADLGIPDNLCTTCGKVAGVYNPSQSSSSKVIPCSTKAYSCPQCSSSSQCQYQISYGDGSGYDARLYSDLLALPGLKPVTQGLGGIYQETPSGPGQPFEPFPVDGIVGIAYQALSETQAPTMIDNLFASGQIANMFSMCMTDDGGTFGFGGMLPYTSGTVTYTPITKQLFYQVSIADVTVAGTSLGVAPISDNTGGAIVDSGTTEFLLPKAAYNAFKSLLLSNCTKNPLVGLCNAGSKTFFDGQCFALTSAQLAAYPAITIHFTGGATLAVPSSAYLLKGACGPTQPNAYALFMDALGVGEGTILGDVVHRPYTVLYDRANARVGWAPVQQCPDGNA
ncbi:MAG: pepsin-like aspartic protease [archaeon]|nr:pepsin-like aspartic protease [archaeon]